MINQLFNHKSANLAPLLLSFKEKRKTDEDFYARKQGEEKVILAHICVEV